MAEVVWTRTALNDLNSIFEYIALDSPIYAAKFCARLSRTPLRLLRFPQSGRIVPELGSDAIRELIVGPYRMIYVSRNDTCYVTAIVHAKRDFESAVNPKHWEMK